MRKNQFFLYKHSVPNIGKATSPQLLNPLTPRLMNFISNIQLNVCNVWDHIEVRSVKLLYFSKNFYIYIPFTARKSSLSPKSNYNLKLWSSLFSTKLPYSTTRYWAQLSNIITPNHTNNTILMFYSLVLGASFKIRNFRILFNLPVNGQRTWSVAKTTTRYNNYVYRNKFFFLKKRFKKLTPATFYSEYFNLLFQFCFHNMWRSSSLRVHQNNFGKKFININNSYHLNGLNLLKLKGTAKQKNLGFSFGFSQKFRKHFL